MDKLSFFVVFAEGVLSLLSPCVLPIIPVYIAILTGSTREDDEYVGPILNTILFVLGISTTFFLLGFTINHFSNILVRNKDAMNIAGGILIVLMGLFFSGIIKMPNIFKSSTKNKVRERKVGPLTSFLLGFTFSWGWSPCVGPMLTSAIIMASNSTSRVSGNIMILVYTLGFILPFLILSIFYDSLSKHLDKLNKHSDKIKKFGGILLIVTGILMATGFMDRFAVNITGNQGVSLQDEIDEKAKDSSDYVEREDLDNPEVIPAIDFTLEDQYGESHTLSDYKGKVVFLNFWATWCPPCRAEMPDMEKVYKERGLNEEDVVVLGVAAPSLGQEGDIAYISKFLEENKISYPVVFDIDGVFMGKYMIQSLPSTFIIDREGNIDLYIPGAIPKETMDQVIDTTLSK